MTNAPQKPPEKMTAAELAEAIRLHREMVQRLIAEARARRDAEKKKKPDAP